MLDRHADGDPGCPVDEEVGDRGRQHGWLGELVVIVGDEVNRVLSDVCRKGHRGRGEPGLGVPGGGGTVVKGAEVPVAVDEGKPEGEGLRHPDERVVDRLVAVGVELAHDLADNAGGLDVGAIGTEPHLTHHVDDAALDGLEAVTGVGKGAGVDDRVRVFEERGLHLLAHVDIDDVRLFGGLGGRHSLVPLRLPVVWGIVSPGADSTPAATPSG